MTKARFASAVLMAVFIGMAGVSAAYAQASRTWVKGDGDDANPCSRTAPCKTFAGAVSKTAAGGEINVLDPGGYGAVTITKSITIDGTGTLASILAAGTNGITINGSGIEVTLRGLTINGNTTGLIGVRIVAASKVFIEDCVIFQFKSGSGRGISDERTNASPASLFMTDTIVRNNSASGVTILPPSGSSTSVKASFDRSRFEGNGNAGLVLGSGAIAIVKSSISTGNTGAGFLVEGPAAASQLTLEDSVTSNNGTGILTTAGGTTRISNNVITNNGKGLDAAFQPGRGGGAAGGTIPSAGGNIVAGNGTLNGPASGPAVTPQ